MNSSVYIYEAMAARPEACPACASVRIRPFIPTASGVEYRCQDCGYRWAVDMRSMRPMSIDGVRGDDVNRTTR
jgi:transposase-like protein